MNTIHAVYQNGVFRPIEPVELPENCEVAFEPRVVADQQTIPTLDSVYSILQKKFDSGQNDIAERHNDHQP